MSFDPTKPVEESDLDAAEMRDQLNGLKALIDTQQAAMDQMQNDMHALMNNVAELQEEVDALQGNP